MLDFLTLEKYSLLSSYDFFASFEKGKYKNIVVFLENLDQFTPELKGKGFSQKDIENLKSWAKELYLPKAEEIRRSKIKIFLELWKAKHEYNYAHFGGFVLGLGGVGTGIDLEKVESNAEEKASMASVIGLSCDFRDADHPEFQYFVDTKEPEEEVPEWLRKKSKTSTKSMGVNISNGKYFIEFLKGVYKNDFVEYPNLRINLSGLFMDLEHRLVYDYDFSRVDFKIIELLGNAKSIMDEFKRMGIGYGPELQRYCEESRKKRVKEYQILHRSHCFDAPGKSLLDPTRWHHGDSIEEFTDRWKETYSAISYVLKHGNAKSLVLKALDNLIRCGLIAIDDLNLEVMKEKSSRWSHYALFLEVAKRYVEGYQKIRKELSGEMVS